MSTVGCVRKRILSLIAWRHTVKATHRQLTGEQSTIFLPMASGATRDSEKSFYPGPVRQTKTNYYKYVEENQ